MFTPTASEPQPVKGKHLKIDAIFVYNDPRDMGLDTQLVLDLVLSHQGYLGTVSPKNGNKEIMNVGYQQDGQPKLFFANTDLFWAAQYHVSRFGSGAFMASLHGLFKAVAHSRTGDGGDLDPKLLIEAQGKPYSSTYTFAERKLLERWSALGHKSTEPLQTVYMVGDNLKSDILGANQFKSWKGIKWSSYLVRTGVWKGEEPTDKREQPTEIFDNVYEAVHSVLAEKGFTEL